MLSMIVKTPDLKKETSVAFGPIGDIYHSYTHVNTGPTVKSSVLIRIHPKCNVHHNQRNHDVVVIILLVYQSSSSVLHVIDEFMVPSTGLQRHEWSHKFM